MLRSPVTGRAFVKLLALAFLAGLAAGAVHTLAQRAVGVFETRDGHASLRATENRPLPASRNALSALTRRRIAAPPRLAGAWARIVATGYPIRSLAELRPYFPEYKNEVNANTIDPQVIRRVDGSWNWETAPVPSPPNCKG